MIKLCIFDLDGTLLNTLPTIAYYGNSALSQYGLPAICEEQYKEFVGDGRDLLIRRMLAESGNDTPELCEKVGECYDRLYEADIMFKTEPYDGINELLKRLADKGITLAVLSNKPHNVASRIVKTKFPDIFTEIWGKRDEYPAKPNPQAALEICRLLGISPTDTAFLGDTSVDVKTGRNAQFYTVGCEWGFRTRAELEEAGADLVVASPNEIDL